MRQQSVACKSREREKRTQDLMIIRERRKHLNAAVNEDNSDNGISDAVDVEEVNLSPVEEINALPCFQVGETASVKGDTSERG